MSALQTAELFDPGSNSFTLTDDVSLGGSQMNAARIFTHRQMLPSYSGNLKVLCSGRRRRCWSCADECRDLRRGEQQIYPDHRSWWNRYERCPREAYCHSDRSNDSIDRWRNR